MAIGIFDYLCADCAHAFELMVLSNSQQPECPRCKSTSVAKQPVLQMSFRGSPRGRVIDMSSNSCPCGCRGGKQHGRRA